MWAVTVVVHEHSRLFLHEKLREKLFAASIEYLVLSKGFCFYPRILAIALMAWVYKKNQRAR